LTSWWSPTLQPLVLISGTKLEREFSRLTGRRRRGTKRRKEEQAVKKEWETDGAGIQIKGKVEGELW
jgi:hypothetical protein